MIRLRHLLRLVGLVMRWTWSGHLPARLRQVRAIRARVLAVARSPLFDANWYSARYPEARGSAWHYVRRGAGEGLSPGPWFDGPEYLRCNAGAAFAGTNPLLDFIERGAAAGAIAAPVRGHARTAQPLNDAGYTRWLEQRASPRHSAQEEEPTSQLPLVTGLGVEGRDEGAMPLRLIIPYGTTMAAGAGKTFEDAATQGTLLAYADSDAIVKGQRRDPRFRPAFDPDFMPDANSLGVHAIADVPDLWARVIAEPCRVRHVPAILSHAPPLPPPPRVRHALPDPPPLVSVIIPTRDGARLLERCVHGLLRETDYPALEILIVDNASRERRTARLFQQYASEPRLRVLPYPAAFNWSALNNFAARQARGDMLLLLNNDIAIRHPDWLRELVSQACRPDVGVAGAKLLYPDGRVQHAGITLGPHGVASHVMRFAGGTEPGYMHMLACVRTVAAVTGACAAIRRSVWDEIGGLEEKLAVTYNDVDLCLRVRARGYRAIYTPFAELTHREAVTRGFDDTPERQARALAERARFCAIWGDMASSDPYVNPNLTVLRETLMLAP